MAKSDLAAQIKETIARNERNDPNFYRAPEDDKPVITDDRYVVMRPREPIHVETFDGPIQISSGWDQIPLRSVYEAHRLYLIGTITRDEYRHYLESGRSKW